MDLIERLQNLDCSVVKRFSFDGLSTLARVINIYDPDTITIAFEHNQEVIKINVRLEGIDAPELKSSNEAESHACVIGAKRLEELIGDKVIRVEFGKFDKYGRPMVRLYTLEPLEESLTCINEYLLKYQYVREYSGEKKVKWTEAELDSIGIKKQS